MLAAQGDQIASAVASLERAGARVGVVAVRLPSAEVIAQHRARELFIPASNQKLLGLAAALQGLGADHEFVTKFALRQGVLVVTACGDPNWTTGGAHDPVQILAEVAAQLRARGVTAVRDVVVDAGTLLGPSRPPRWSIYDAALNYCPPTGAMVLDAGCFEAEVAVVAGAARARIDVVAPPVPLSVEGGIAVTSDRKKGEVYGIAVRGDALRAHGALWHKAGARRVRGALPDGDAIAVRALRECLLRAGIGIDPAAPGQDIPALHEHRSPLRDALAPLLHDSSNFHAEQVARALGAARHGDGSCAGGSRATAKELEQLVGAWPGMVIDDAAGLSRDNQVSPGFVVAVLAACAAKPWGPTFVESLPTGGEGTLRRRLRDGEFEVRAKTGTLRDVSALSGYIDRADGSRLAFSILVNVARGGKVAHAQWRAEQDKIVAALAKL